MKKIELSSDALTDRYGEAVAQFLFIEMEKAARLNAAPISKRPSVTADSMDIRLAA